jgi:class 3 adenylate cyclase
MGGNFELGLADLMRTQEILDRLGNDALQAGLDLIWTQIARAQGHHALADEKGHRSMETAERLGVGFVAALSASSVGNGWVFLDPKASFPIYERALEKLGTAQAPVPRSMLLNGLACARATAGRLEEVRPLLPELSESGMNQDFVRFFFDWDLAEAGAKEQSETLRAGGVRGMPLAEFRLLGTIRELKGDDEGARAAHLQCIARAEEVGLVEALPIPRLSLAALEARCGDLAAADAHLAKARELFDGPEDLRGLVGVLRRTEAAVAAAKGDWTTARDAFARSIEILSGFGVPFEEAETNFVWGNALLRSGDRRSALEKLDRALEIYRRIGAASQWLERVLALKMHAQGSESSDIKASIALVAASVEAKRPSMSLATGADGSVTLMFSDMHDYTGMMERLGDRDALRVVEDHNRIVRTHCEAHGGFEVELRGDGFLVAFSTPLTGVRCAVALQLAFEAYSRGHPEQPIQIRIGLHCGEAIRDQDKFFGRTVIHAFRVADLAASEEILVSEQVISLVRDRGFQFSHERDVTLKGFSGTHSIARVEWRAP